MILLIASYTTLFLQSFSIGEAPNPNNCKVFTKSSVGRGIIVRFVPMSKHCPFGRESGQVIPKTLSLLPLGVGLLKKNDNVNIVMSFGAYIMYYIS